MVVSKKKSAARAPRAKGVRNAASSTRALADGLAEAAWSEADLALAQALVDFDEAMHARGSARGEAMDMLGLSLARAARKRGLSRFGQAGARETFDPNRHDAAGGASKVEIVTAGVARAEEVLIRARTRKAP